MNSFTALLNNNLPKHVPVWMMRQAGRVLPRYMELRKKYSFAQLMQTPELAAQITLMPVQDLGVDAAILFSDILVVPQALGLDLQFTDNGPVFDNPLLKFSNPEKVLKPQPEKLEHIYKAIDIILEKKAVDLPLIGFCGGPLTVLLYMLEGLGTKSYFANAEKFIFQNRKTTEIIVDTIAEISIHYVENQLKHGVSCIRLFESNCGNIPFELYKKLFLPTVKKICNLTRIYGKKFLFFPKGIGLGIADINLDVCDWLSLDWQTSIYSARKLLDNSVNIEGNLDPRILLCSKEDIKSHINFYFRFAYDNPNWIFNLGHGVLPNTPFDNAKFVVDVVKNIRI